MPSSPCVVWSLPLSLTSSGSVPPLSLCYFLAHLASGPYILCVSSHSVTSAWTLFFLPFLNLVNSYPLQISLYISATSFENSSLFPLTRPITLGSHTIIHGSLSQLQFYICLCNCLIYDILHH